MTTPGNHRGKSKSVAPCWPGCFNQNQRETMRERRRPQKAPVLTFLSHLRPRWRSSRCVGEPTRCTVPPPCDTEPRRWGPFFQCAGEELTMAASAASAAGWAGWGGCCGSGPLTVQTLRPSQVCGWRASSHWILTDFARWAQGVMMLQQAQFSLALKTIHEVGGSVCSVFSPPAVSIYKLNYSTTANVSLYFKVMAFEYRFIKLKVQSKPLSVDPPCELTFIDMPV